MTKYSIRSFNFFDNKFIFGDDIEIGGLNFCNCETKKNNILTFVTSADYIKNIQLNKNISAVILKKEDFERYLSSVTRKITYIFSNLPEELFYNFHHFLISNTDFYNIDKAPPTIGIGCDIKTSVIIENGVSIGNNVRIMNNSIIRRGTKIGDNVYIGANSVIGSEGFQVISFGGNWRNIYHVGGLQIENDVHIGDNCTISNSLFEDSTIIKRNVKIDNHVYVAHNCYVGENTILTASVNLCGSTKIFESCWIGMNSTILNKCVVNSNTIIGIGSVVTKNIPSNSVAYGNPAVVHRKNEI